MTRFEQRIEPRVRYFNFVPSCGLSLIVKLFYNSKLLLEISLLVFKILSNEPKFKQPLTKVIELDFFLKFPGVPFCYEKALFVKESLRLKYDLIEMILVWSDLISNTFFKYEFLTLLFLVATLMSVRLYVCMSVRFRGKCDFLSLN